MSEALSRLDSVRKILSKEPLDLWLSPDAFEAFDARYGSTYSKRIGLGVKAGSALGKLAGMVARLAGCLHLLDFAFKEDAELALPTKISASKMSSALGLVELYFVKQIERAYYGADNLPEERIAADLLAHCRVNGVRSFNIRQARREWGIAGASRKGAALEFEAAAGVLADAGWARALQSQNRAKDFELNPALFEE